MPNMNTKTSGAERRKDHRIDRRVPVKICSEGGDIVTETGNISRSGAYRKVTRYIEPMTKMKIQLLLPLKVNGKNVNKKISCQGVAVRTEPISGEEAYNVAIFFNDITQKDAEIIADFINSCLD